MDIVETKEVSKVYRTFYGSVTALDNISLKMGTGVTGILGPNGSGKTTLIKLISGIIKPTRGEVLTFGENPWKMNIKKKISYLPEKPVFPKNATVEELTKYIAKARGIPIETLVDSLSYFEIFDMNRKIGALSAGMTQKIGLAYTLSSDQDLIILDEPTANLDPVWRKKVLNLIKQKGKDSTILFSTHILHDVEKVADNIVIILHSKLLLNESINNIKSKYSSLTYEIHFKNGNVVKTKSLEKFVSSDIDYIITQSFELDDLFEVIINERAN